MRATLLAFILAIAASVTTAVAGERSPDCVGDVNGDSVVDVLDLLQVVAEWGCSGCPSDVNNDGITDVLDMLVVISDWGCESPQGPITNLSGIVTNLWTGDPVADASVFVGVDELITGPDGTYSGDFSVGQYTLVFEADNFVSQEEQIVLFPDLPAVVDVALEPVAAVIVSVSFSGEAEPGAAVEATATVEIYDGSTIESFAWMQTFGAPVGITGGNTATATLNLGPAMDYKLELIHALSEPAIEIEGEAFHGGIQSRFEIVGINPFALEEAGLIAVEVDVTTTSGTYSEEAEVHTHIPWKSGIGIRNVAIGIPVLLHGKDQASYDWALTVPAGSGATLLDATTQYPEFTPDIPGLYEATVTDIEAASVVTIQIYAGNWRGVIVGQDEDGRPVSDPSCVGCHVSLGADKFAAWAQSGHAEIFSDNLDTSTHYGPNCFPCHTVGYDTDVFNEGFDDAFDYLDFLDSGLINNPGDNWTTMLADYPYSAQLGNIQCENCHGPQYALPGVQTPAHGPIQPEGEPRLSLSSDMCASCHGEPLRHARFQQWQVSGHANYELAIDESQSGSCSKCHTANGFMAWLPSLLAGDPAGSVEVTWTADEAHPQTCVVCHDPHDIGTTSGNDSNAKMRITGHTPPLESGFTAYGVGRGAICMVCHNSRRGLRNDDHFEEIYGTAEAARSPHGPSQTDILMGENAYNVLVGFRGNHSFVSDSCVGCHLEKTEPPAELSYNLGGTNHTFGASLDICADCHGEGFEAEAIQEGVEETMHILGGLIEDALLALIAEQTGLGNIIDLNGDVQITDVADIEDIEFGEYHGRQAMTVTLTGGVVYGPYRMNDVDVLDPGLVVLGMIYDFASPELVKGGWNYLMVHNDGSLGIHNPTFSYQVMGSAIEGLSGGDYTFQMPSFLKDWMFKNEKK